MASQQEGDAFVRGWRAAMEEVLAVLAAEAQEFAADEKEAEASGGYKLPGSFALEEVRGSFKGRRDLTAWIAQVGPAAGNANDPQLRAALEALIEGHASNEQRAALGLAPVAMEEATGAEDAG